MLDGGLVAELEHGVQPAPGLRARALTSLVASGDAGDHDDGQEDEDAEVRAGPGRVPVRNRDYVVDL